MTALRNYLEFASYVNVAMNKRAHYKVMCYHRNLYGSMCTMYYCLSVSTFCCTAMLNLYCL